VKKEIENMNAMLNALKNETNFTYTENGALTHKTTRSDLLDMFAMGAAYRSRSDEDVIVMFRKAFKENPVYAMKCLFYIRDVRGGQGERRFFRVCMRDLATQDLEAAKRNMLNVPEYGRWDDLLVFIGTPLERKLWLSSRPSWFLTSSARLLLCWLSGCLLRILPLRRLVLRLP